MNALCKAKQSAIRAVLLQEIDRVALPSMYVGLQVVVAAPQAATAKSRIGYSQRLVPHIATTSPLRSPFLYSALEHLMTCVLSS